VELVQSLVRKTNVPSLFVILCILNLFDAIETHYLVSVSDPSTELNPIIRALISHDSLLLYLWKTIILAFVWLTLHRCIGTKYEIPFNRILIGANVLMLAVVTWDTFLINNL